MAGVGDLHSLASQLLAACATSLDTIPLTSSLEGAPERRFVSLGLPVLDCCDQLAVHIPFVNHGETSPGGLASGKRFLTGALNHTSFIITLTRCYPSPFDDLGNYMAPAPAVLEATAEQGNADAWALWNGLYMLQSSDQLLSLCDEVFFDGISAMTPSGGCAGWTGQVRASLDGYNPFP